MVPIFNRKIYSYTGSCVFTLRIWRMNNASYEYSVLEKNFLLSFCRKNAILCYIRIVLQLGYLNRHYRSIVCSEVTFELTLNWLKTELSILLKRLASELWVESRLTIKMSLDDSKKIFALRLRMKIWK